MVQQLQTLLPVSSQAPVASNIPRGVVPGASLKQAFQPTMNAAPVSASQSAVYVQTQQPETEESFECLIPGCGQPVYVDAHGLKPSAYCSMRHRQ